MSIFCDALKAHNCNNISFSASVLNSEFCKMSLVSKALCLFIDWAIKTAISLFTFRCSSFILSNIHLKCIILLECVDIIIANLIIESLIFSLLEAITAKASSNLLSRINIDASIRENICFCSPKLTLLIF